MLVHWGPSNKNQKILTLLIASKKKKQPIFKNQYYMYH